MIPSPASLDRIFTTLKQLRFVVLGDFCLDAYFFLNQQLSEISIETGLNTLAVASMRFTPGGAGNVAANLSAMGATRVHALGVVGDDLYGREYLRLLSRQGIDTSDLLIQADHWQTCVYSKLYDGERELPRIDMGRTNRLAPASAHALLTRLNRLLPKSDVVLINQQLQNGIHGPILKAGLTAAIARHSDIVWLLDAREEIDAYPGTIRKLNHEEAVKAAALEGRAHDPQTEATVRRAADALFRRWGTPFCITRGARGGLCRDAAGSHLIPGLHFTTKLDTVGAGDSIFAGLAAGLAADLALPKALGFATLVAGVTIQKQMQTGTASEGEIRTLARDPDFNYHPEAAAAPERAILHGASEIEIVADPPLFETITCALFDHDGTISTLREGWEHDMAPMMMDAIFGADPEGVDPDLQARVRAEVEAYISQTTGLRTLVQMEGLARLVEARGLVPPEGILDPRTYKEIYLQKLHRSVDRRMAELARGERAPADFTIRGAVAFLKELGRRGVKLFLASGTDEVHLRPEAAALGYADLFDGGIYGAEDSSADEPKKIVLEKILAQIGTDPASGFVAFGDGPVEIREAVKRGGVGVGVASDEIRRCGLNPAKRERLVLAGAHFVVPDFSQADQLLDLLFPQPAVRL